MLKWDVVSKKIINPEDEHPTVVANVALMTEDGGVIATRDFQYVAGHEEALEEAANQWVASFDEEKAAVLARSAFKEKKPKDAEKQQDQVVPIVDALRAELDQKLLSLEEKLERLKPESVGIEDKREVRDLISQTMSAMNAILTNQGTITTKLDSIDQGKPVSKLTKAVDSLTSAIQAVSSQLDTLIQKTAEQSVMVQQSRDTLVVTTEQLRALVASVDQNRVAIEQLVPSMDRVISAIDAEEKQYTALSASVNDVSVQVDQAVRALKEEMYASDSVTAADVKESVSDNFSQLEARVNANLDGVVKVINDRVGILERTVTAINSRLDEIMVSLSKHNPPADVI